MNTTYDQTPCVLDVVGISLARNPESEFAFHKGGHQRKAQVWQVANQRLAAPPREGAYGPPYVTGARLDTFSLGGRRKVLKAQLFSRAQAAGNWLGGSVGTTSGSWTDVEIRCDWWASEHPIPAPSPLASSLLTRLSRSPPHWESSSYQMERGEEGNGAINFPLQTLLCESAWRQPLQQMTPLFLWCYSKGCTIYQQCFLIT